MFRRVSLFALACCAPLVAAQQGWTQSDYTQTMMMGVAMVNRSVGFIAGAQNGYGANILKTVDGGINWQQVNIASQTPPMMLMAVAANSAESAVVGGFNFLAGSTLFTKDGENFENAKEGTGKLLLDSVTAAYTINGSDSSFGIVGGFQTTKASYSVGISTDNGASFTFSATPTNQSVRYGAFPSAEVIYVTFGNWPNTTSNSSAHADHTFISRDISIDRRTNRVMRHKHSKTDRDVSNAYFAQIMASKDGGATWESQFMSTEFYFNEIGCSSETQCYAIGSGPTNSYLYGTFDGSDWDLIAEIADTSLLSLQVLSESEIWLSGATLEENAIALFSNNGGLTWVNQTIPNQMFLSMSFTDANFGVATTIDAISQQSGIMVFSK